MKKYAIENASGLGGRVVQTAGLCIFFKCEKPNNNTPNSHTISFSCVHKPLLTQKQNYIKKKTVHERVNVYYSTHLIKRYDFMTGILSG